jgi:hypothetical protein
LLPLFPVPYEAVHDALEIVRRELAKAETTEDGEEVPHEVGSVAAKHAGLVGPAVATEDLAALCLLEPLEALSATARSGSAASRWRSPARAARQDATIAASLIVSPSHSSR